MLIRLKQLTYNVKTHQGFRRYFAITSWLFAEQILRIIAGLLVGIYVARYLGPEKFGLFNFALAFVALFGSFAKLGLDGIIVRDLVNTPEKRDIYLGTAFWLKVIGAGIAGAGIVVVVAITENDLTTKLFIGIIASGLIFQSFEVVDFYFQSRVLSKYVSICKISQLILSSLLKLYFVAINADLFWFVLVSVIDQASLAAALAYAYSKQKLGAFYVHFDKAVAKELLISAKPLIISGIMVSVYSSIDRVIIKEMLGVREVGIYVAASGLTGAMSFVPTIVSNSIFPAILNAKQKAPEKYARLLITLSKTLVIFGVLVCLLVSLFASSIVNLLYGHQYADSVGVLQIYVWSFLLICFASIFGKWLLAENLQYFNFRFTVVALLINLFGNYFLIPIFSVNGAAWAFIAAQFIPFPLMLLIDKNLRNHMRDLLQAK